MNKETRRPKFARFGRLRKVGIESPESRLPVRDKKILPARC